MSNVICNTGGITSLLTVGTVPHCGIPTSASLRYLKLDRPSVMVTKLLYDWTIVVQGRDLEKSQLEKV